VILAISYIAKRDSFNQFFSRNIPMQGALYLLGELPDAAYKCWFRKIELEQALKLPVTVCLAVSLPCYNSITCHKADEVLHKVLGLADSVKCSIVYCFPLSWPADYVCRAAQLAPSFYYSEKAISRLALSRSSVCGICCGDTAPNDKYAPYLWLYDSSANKLLLSNKLLKLIGSSGDNAVNHEAIRARIHPCDLSFIDHFAAKIKHGSPPEPIQVRLATNAGGYRWFRISATLCGCGSLYGLVHNIDKEKELESKAATEKKLHIKAKQQLGVAQKVSKLGLWSANITTGEISWSKEFALLLDIDPNEQCNTEILAGLLAPDEMRRFKTELLPSFMSGQNSTHYIRVNTFSGKILYLRILSFFSPSAAQQELRFNGIAQDITDLKLKELELKKSNDELFAANRKMQLYTEELEQAKQKSEESDNLKTAFLSNLSHEIRTPISCIGGFAELLRPQFDKLSKQRRYVDLILQSNSQLLNIFNDMLDLSKITANQLKLELSETDISSLIQEIESDFLPLLGDKKIKLVLDLPISGQGTSYYADPSKLRKIIWYILNNSLKFTYDGHIKISYKYYKSNITVSISDTGVGIPEEAQAYIFEPFRQGDSSMSRKHGGAGLGLAIVDGLIKIMGGFLCIESCTGKGTDVSFTFPAKPASGQIPEVADSAADSGLWADKLILIVEDDQINYMYLVALLKSTDAALIHAKTLAFAKQLILQHNKIDCVLLDLKLPDGLGTDLINIAADRINPKQFVIVSAVEESHSNLDTFRGAVSSVLHKPFSKEGLIAAIETVFTNQL
jgi:signal transduction histidine kinase/CheY-like chemotaxis protein